MSIMRTHDSSASPLGRNQEVYALLATLQGADRSSAQVAGLVADDVRHSHWCYRDGLRSGDGRVVVVRSGERLAQLDERFRGVQTLHKCFDEHKPVAVTL